GGGKGGSMHVADVERGMLGANGIVGGGFGIAAGAALTIKTLEQEHVAVCFFGDGASNEGTFHEGLNLASILDLPVIFVCENRSEEHTSELQSRFDLVCRLLLEKKKILNKYE